MTCAYLFGMRYTLYKIRRTLAKKSISTSFGVRAAPKSWLKYTNQLHLNSGVLFGSYFGKMGTGYLLKQGVPAVSGGSLKWEPTGTGLLWEIFVHVIM